MCYLETSQLKEGQLEEPRTSAVWNLFDETTIGNSAVRSSLGDAVMGVRSCLEEPLKQRAADVLK